jgi:hypothetical protein
MDFSKFCLSSLVKSGINLRPFLEKLEKIEVVDTFTDAHELCGKIRFTLKSSEKHEVEFLWVGWGLLAACTYANICEEAAQRVIEYLGEGYIPMCQDMYKDYQDVPKQAQEFRADLGFFGIEVEQ